jgi:hypothetical protein
VRKTVAWKIVFQKRERPREKGVYICFTKYETVLQVKKFIESGILIHEIQKDGKIAFNRAQVAAKFGSRARRKFYAS